MPIKTTPDYTEFEVSRILRDSEHAAIDQDDRGEGHAETLHEMQALGRNRASISDANLELRVVGPERKRLAGAFVGCQAAAVTLALNRKAGQAALSWLCMDTCKFVFVRIDISTGSFPCVTYDVDQLEPPASGATFAVGPSGVDARGRYRIGLVLTGIPRTIHGFARGIGMKLMKTPGKELHIRTAFPLVAAPSPQRAAITWMDDREQMQDLPV